MDPLENLLRSIGEVMALLVGWIVDSITKIANNFWAFVLFLLASLLIWLDYISSALDSAFAYITGLMAIAKPDLTIYVNDFWRMGNAILPLSEALALLGVMMVAKAFAVAYRMVKSWIPLV